PLSASGYAGELATGALQMIGRTRMIRMAAMTLAASVAVVSIGMGIGLLSNNVRAQSDTAESGKSPAGAERAPLIETATTLPATRPSSLTMDQVISGV